MDREVKELNIPNQNLEEFKPGLLAQYDSTQRAAIVVNKSLETENPNIQIFRKGPLDLRSFGLNQSWIQPVKIFLPTGQVDFHVLYLGCANLTAAQAQVNLLPYDELTLKLATESDESYDYFVGCIRTAINQPQILVRPCQTGCFYQMDGKAYINFVNNNQIQEALMLLMQETGLSLNNAIRANFANNFSIETSYWRTNSKYSILSPIQIDFGGQAIFVYKVIARDSDWKYFEIFSPTTLDSLNMNGSVLLRIDSGCDTGECYHDNGCDCRAQFHNALRSIQTEGGLIIHCPTQDGRGYGLITKLCTEALKAGLNPFNDARIRPLDTIQSAINLLGNDFDARTYFEPAQILRMLNIHDVTLLTDNRRKIQDLESEGLIVRRRPTGTLVNGGHYAQQHVQAKHEHPLYIQD